jgi:hypothetical protein
MILSLKHYGNDATSSGGALSINGKFFCHTCEDEPRLVKMVGETRVRPGCYEIRLRAEGGMHDRYDARYPWHRGMLHLQDVQDFTYIYIHPGNDEGQTDGCILVGYRADSKGGFDIGRSMEAYKDLYQLILVAMEKGEQIFIEVED